MCAEPPRKSELVAIDPNPDELNVRHVVLIYRNFQQQTLSDVKYLIYLFPS